MSARTALRDAVATMAAALATLACTWAIAPTPGAAVLAVVLCLSLSRSRLDRSLRGRVEAALLLPLVSLAAMGVGLLLHRLPLVGACAFTVCVAASIWLRRFGVVGRQVGTLIALPFVVVLVVPPQAHAAPLAVLGIAMLALFWVSVVHALGRRPPPAPPVDAQPSTMRPRPSTRMALQMGLALALAFAVGMLFFHERWAWVVLTAFIVNAGNQGRLDVLYKGVLRLAGAAAGTVLALALADRVGDARLAAAMTLAAVFLGVWLRPLGYGWWALFITLALALLQALQGQVAQLGLRLEEIVIGAVIGVAAAWWLLPLRSTDVLRRRIATALAAFDPATRKAGELEAALEAVAQLAPPFRALRMLGHRQPADWIDAMAAMREPALALTEAGGALRKAIGAARLALREPAAELDAALQALRERLQT